MEKKYIIGGLAIVGAIAVLAYLNKPKKNLEGFYNASGNTGKTSQLPSGCVVCKGGVSNYYAVYGRCKKGDACVR